MRLIDADKLRTEVTKHCPDCSMNGTNYCHYACDVNVCIKDIDNAPTVDTTCKYCDSGYAQGHSDGYLQGREERPQGEWVKDGIGSYRCSLCGRVICTSISNDKPYEDYPFCHCGAGMKGGEEK